MSSSCIDFSQNSAKADSCFSLFNDSQPSTSERATNHWRNVKREVNVLARRNRSGEVSVLAQLIVILKTFATFVILVLLLSALLFWLERDQIYAQVRSYFEFADDVGEGYCAWMGALYVSYLAAHRVGYGDVLVVTTAGRSLIMLISTISTPFSVVFSVRCGQLLQRALRKPARALGAKYGCRAREMFFAAAYASGLVFLTVLNATYLNLTPSKDDQNLSWTDAIWYSWSTFTTVGFGDISFATLPSVSLTTWIVQYCVFVVGAVLLDSLVAQAFAAVDNCNWEPEQGVFGHTSFRWISSILTGSWITDCLCSKDKHGYGEQWRPARQPSCSDNVQEFSQFDGTNPDVRQQPQ